MSMDIRPRNQVGRWLHLPRLAAQHYGIARSYAGPAALVRIASALAVAALKVARK
jgi:hypothetical protein